jgi:polyisoprenyl-teichoic acid--peptidoglycan teichoic acid transferase
MGAAFRSTIVPGWGQLVTNRPVVGRALVFITGLLAVAALTVFLFVEPIELLSWFADPDVLLLVVVGNLAFAAIRLFSTGHAWMAGGGRRWFAGILLLAFVAIPHAAVAWVGLETRDSLIRVFPESTQVAAPASTTTTTTPPTTTTLPPTPTTTEFSVSPVVVGPFLPGNDAFELDLVPRTSASLGKDRLNVLLLGGDAGPGRSGLRTDTMVVASVDPMTGDAALIGVPRNFGGVTLQDGTAVPVIRLSHVYWWGTRNPDRFAGDDPGVAAVQDAIEHITGLRIDHHMLVDLTGFADLIDAFGGVHLDVPVPVDGPLYDTATGEYEMVHIPSGSQVLDGDHALAYARARYGSSDYVRMGRQRCILAAMARDADRFQLLRKFSGILEAIKTNVSTDLPIDLLPDMVKLADRIDGDRIRVIGFDSTWRAGRTSDGHAIPDIDRIREAVAQIVESSGSGDDAAAMTAEAVCG